MDLVAFSADYSRFSVCAALFRMAGYDASGLEFRPWVVDCARRTFDVPGLLGPLGDQGLEANGLDVIVLMDVLEHLPGPVGPLKRCVEMLKADGVLLI